MLTRIKINGFKNLRDIDLRLGLFNCVAGSNGVGKSGSTPFRVELDSLIS